MPRSADFIKVSMDDSATNLQTFADGDITSVDLGLTYDQYDVSGFGNAFHKMQTGKVQAPITLKGFLTTTATNGTHTVIRAVYANKAQVTFKVAVGNNTAPVSGDPEFSGEFYVTSYVPSLATGGAVTFTATLVPATDIAPVWGTKP
jgi:hypothetical protein